MNDWLTRLQDASLHRQPGINRDYSYVRREDLRKILHHFDRLDYYVRSSSFCNGDRKDTSK